MKKERLKVDHKKLIELGFKNISCFISEYCFSNLYLFRKKHRYRIFFNETCFFIKGVTYDKKKFIMPGCDLNYAEKERLFYYIKLLDKVDMLFPIPEEWLYLFPENSYKVELLLDDLDYVYERKKMADFPGRKLQKKRNLKNQFLNSYNSKFEKISAKQHIKDAKYILKKWQEQSNFKTKKETDYYPCYEALNKIDELNLEGFIYYVDNSPVGFSLGAEISSKVFGLHFVKALKDVKGIYQYIFSTTAEMVDKKYSYINLEQDLGQEPLRITKSSYIPDIMVRKYRVIKR